MNKQSGIHYLHPQKAQGMDPVLPSEIVRIRDTVAAGLSDLLQGAFDAVDDSLFELANNSRSNNEQNRYFEAMREIRIKRKGVEKQFKIALNNLFNKPPLADGTEHTDSEEPSADRLALVQNDELEEQVALSTMISKAKAHFQGPLLQLQARFTAAYKQDEQHPVNPLAPEHLCRAFAESAETLEIQIRERLIVLKQFDRYVISNLGMLFDEANRILIQAGIIPNFRYQGRAGKQVERNESQPGSSEGKHTASSEQGHQATAEDMAAADSMFEQIRQLIARQNPGTMFPPSAYNPTNMHYISGAELLHLLTNTPPGPDFSGVENLSAGEPLAIDLREAVKQILLGQKTSDGKHPALKEVDEDLINLVSMLFEFILDDDNLSAPIQVLISRLQIPILKVAIKDKSFFSRATHPARKLLNALARAGIGWSDANEKAKDKLYEQIHIIVARILSDFDGDLSLFEKLGEEFDQFLARENRKATLVEQRTRESERGRIKSQKAQETVDQFLQQRLEGRQLPGPVREILVHGWSRVMFLAYLRDDVEHRWQHATRIVDDLLWCLHPHTEDAERDQWVRVVPSLLKALRAGLEEVSYNASRLDDMMASLKHELTEAFRCNHVAEARPTTDEAEPAAGPVNSQQAETQKDLDDAAIAEFVTQIEQIHVGDWVEFNLVNGTRFRCKLSAIIDEADCFVFVNRMGLKVIEKSRVELAHEMRRGRLNLLEQGALVDRALDAVMSKLRRSA